MSILNKKSVKCGWKILNDERVMRLAGCMDFDMVIFAFYLSNRELKGFCDIMPRSWICPSYYILEQLRLMRISGPYVAVLYGGLLSL